MLQEYKDTFYQGQNTLPNYDGNKNGDQKTDRHQLKQKKLKKKLELDLICGSNYYESNGEVFYMDEHQGN